MMEEKFRRKDVDSFDSDDDGDDEGGCDGGGGGDAGLVLVQLEMMKKILKRMIIHLSLDTSSITLNSTVGRQQAEITRQQAEIEQLKAENERLKNADAERERQLQ
ncbi:hypothetical protein Hanom_Chr14g01282271 [Helianthus anomalus]